MDITETEAVNMKRLAENDLDRMENILQIREECKKIEKVLRKNNISYFEKWKFHTGLFHVISSRKNSKCDIYIHSDSIERAKQALGIQTTK